MHTSPCSSMELATALYRVSSSRFSCLQREFAAQSCGCTTGIGGILRSTTFSRKPCEISVRKVVVLFPLCSPQSSRVRTSSTVSVSRKTCNTAALGSAVPAQLQPAIGCSGFVPSRRPPKVPRWDVLLTPLRFWVQHSEAGCFAASRAQPAPKPRECCQVHQVGLYSLPINLDPADWTN